jgi:hypothetical protein
VTRLLAALLIVALAAGCSGDGGDEPDAVSPTATPTSETSTAPEQPPGVAEDLNDVGGPLDLERASAVRTGDLIAVSITTYEPWEDDLLTGPRLDKQGSNRLTVLYDTDLDERADYTGKIIFAEGALSLVISGQGQAFEPVPAERPDDATAGAVHPVDIFRVETDIQVAVESSAVGFKDRIPTEGWLLVPFGPT